MELVVEDKIEIIQDIEEEQFEFKCPYCNSTNIDMRPLGKSYVFERVGMSENLGKSVSDKLSEVPVIADLLIKTDTENILACCEDCNISFTPTGKIVVSKLRSWIKKKFGEESLGSMKELHL